MSRALTVAGWWAVLLIAFPPLLSSRSVSQEQTRRLENLQEDYWEAVLENSPTYATFLGDPRYNGLLEEIGSEGRKAWQDRLDGLWNRAGGIDPEGLSRPDRVSWEVLRFRLDLDRRWYPQKLYQWNVDQIDGPQSWFPQLMNFTPLKTEKDVQDLIARFQKIPKYIDQYIGNLKEGVLEGRVAPRLAVQRVLKQLEGLLQTPPESSPFGLKVQELPSELSEKYRNLTLGEIQNSVYPAFEKLRDFFRQSYLAKSRKTRVGLWALPGGSQAYRYLITYHTTLDFSPGELHRIGREELSRIQAEMKGIAKRMGHAGSLSAFLEKMRKDTGNFFTTREEILETARGELQRATRRLPRFFGRLPKTECVVKPIEDYREKDAPAAFYYPADDRGERPAIYYINTYDPASRDRYGTSALAAHEALPGHHLQIALAMENRDLPDFRRHVGFTAFIEGWALYAERLAEEMELYQEELSRMGMLTFQAWRACRLVVDTGLHSMRWEREQTIEFLRENAPLSDEEIGVETDRYIIWPGQALAYMVGSREIRSIRREAQERLGVRFDIRKFHDTVLENGSVPLPVLRRLVREWVTSQP
ncbi:MAG: DUF885 domain-containing protein [Elusimicrobia bacterium]|nr:DUF885 domain-containing protein [Elusimicrobiota bacterium]